MHKEEATKRKENFSSCAFDKRLVLTANAKNSTENKRKNEKKNLKGVYIWGMEKYVKNVCNLVKGKSVCIVEVEKINPQKNFFLFFLFLLS